MATRPADASSTAAAAAADVGRTSNFAAGSDWPISKGLQGVLLQNTGLWLVPVTPRGQLQALMAGLLFGLHPVHTEASCVETGSAVGSKTCKGPLQSVAVVSLGRHEYCYWGSSATHCTCELADQKGFKQLDMHGPAWSQQP
eukprot:GHRR01034391.1.p1 GENE.GHRR01034391.1~~GHRR01034391.1.p1  ORF type:complete len:142 (+),score=48.62 GHRR01034391.1:915-1340(+)